MKKNLLALSIALISFSALVFSGCEKEDPDAIQMDTVNKGIQIIEGADGKQYEVVDLGLPSGNLWATCNMGASSPEKTGSFYAWGEVETKEEFSWRNYRWSEGNDLDITKYYTEDRGNYSRVGDQKTQLEIADEAPYAVMGQGWRLPSDTDFRELLTTRNCTVKWCKLNGVGGYLFTSVRKGYEGNSIFLPLSGMNDSTKPRFEGEYGWYWCNTLYLNYNTNTGKNEYVTSEATALWLEHVEIDNHVIKSRPRYAGIPIRPVYVGK